jgi:hypothetical protein
MMDMNGMMDRCIDAMGSMMGGSMMGAGLYSCSCSCCSWSG